MSRQVTFSWVCEDEGCARLFDSRIIYMQHLAMAHGVLSEKHLPAKNPTRVVARGGGADVWAGAGDAATPLPAPSANGEITVEQAREAIEALRFLSLLPEVDIEVTAGAVCNLVALRTRVRG